MDDGIETAQFFDLAIKSVAGVDDKLGRNAVRVLDFGCGSGRIVRAMADIGYEVYGCDIVSHVDADDQQRYRQIQLIPYRLPFDDDTFDIVISTSVLEHARNPEEYLPEIHRLLKPGGAAMHILPGKWYLPYEPHILVPLANWFYPNCPTWWFALWTLVGHRAPGERGMGWRDATRAYRTYYDTGLFYLNSRDYGRLSRAVFGNCDWPMDFYIEHAPGGFAKVFRKLPFRRIWGVISREFRMGFLVQRKTI